MREEKGLVRDPMLDTAYQDLECLRDNLQQAQEKHFRCRSLHHDLWRQRSRARQNRESEMKSILESRTGLCKTGAFPARTRLQEHPADRDDELDVHSKLNSSPLSSTFSFRFFRPHVRQRNSLRHQQAQFVTRPFRPLFARKLQFDHVRKIRLRKIIRDQTRNPANPYVRHRRHRHRPGKRIRIPGGSDRRKIFQYFASIPNTTSIRLICRLPAKTKIRLTFCASTSSISSDFSASCSADSRRKKMPSSTERSPRPMH